jgi:MFS transporter, MFS domain-containing protein family, molybdate-anion transporter
MLGSMVYSKMLEWVGHDTKRILLWTFALAATALLGAVASLYETWTFWSFMLFEVCIGIYFPAMSKLKGDMVKESVRATIYALFRLPLNVFVIVMLNAFSRGKFQCVAAH